MNQTVVRILLLLFATAPAVSCLQPGTSNLPVGPKSIILIVADGTGIGQHTYAYYLGSRFSLQRFEHVGLMTTHPADSLKVTESGAAATAMATGYKTYTGAIGVDENKRPLKTVLEYAHEKGMATGLVATSTITHATPAAFATHVVNRSDEPEIARQMAVAGITVIFGGGRKYFLSQPEGGEQNEDLLAAMVSRQVQVIDSLRQPIDPSRPVVGLFSMGSMPWANENRRPTTTAMALRAVDILERDPDGFFLMVEESQVDWAGHKNDTKRLHSEVESLQELVGALLDYQADHPQVLVLLVADHETGGLAVKDKSLGAGLKTAWVTKGHTGNLVPIFASGPGSEAFDAVVDNTFIGQKLIAYVTSR